MAIRVTRISTQVAGESTGADLRVTRTSVQVAGEITNGKIRVTRISTQVAGKVSDSNGVMTDIFASVVSTDTNSHNFQSELGIFDSMLVGSTMGLGIPPDPVTVHPPTTYERTADSSISFSQSATGQAPTELTADNSITFTQLAEGSAATMLTADNTITFTHSVDANGIYGRTADSSVAFSVVSGVVGEVVVTAENTITFTQTGDGIKEKDLSASSSIVFNQSSRYTPTVLTSESTIVFNQSGRFSESLDITAVSEIVFNQNTHSGFYTRTATSQLSLNDSNNRIHLGQGGLDLDGYSTITFSQSNNRVRYDASGTILTASGTINFTCRGLFPIFLTASNYAKFAQANGYEFGMSAGSEIDFSTLAIGNMVRNLTATSVLDLKQSITYAQIRDGIPIASWAPCKVTQVYAPFGGNGAIRAKAPNLSKRTDVQFYYPATNPCSAQYLMTLRTPNFGDRDRNKYNRINRESRGGSLVVFRDPKWPKQRTLLLDFSGILDSEVDNILSFFQNTLGLPIGFRDWQNRVWRGIITNPNSPVIFSKRNNNDLAIELDVMDDSFMVTACNTIVFTQSAVGVK